MRTIKASEFKARCLQLMEEVAETGDELVITKHGKPISKLTPYEEPTRELYARHRGSMRVVGEILEPVDEVWDADR